jgi:HEAT repeat protein
MMTDEFWHRLGFRRPPGAPETPAPPLSMGVDTEAGSGLGLLASEHTVPSLLSALEDERADVRRTAVWALGEADREEAVRALIELLRSEDQVVREEAIDALVKQSDRSRPALIRAIQDPELREAASEALEKIRAELMERLIKV